ncbi:MAG: T9SS type A sorting domain-containing protein, partial [Ferruginibacter sp.]
AAPNIPPTANAGPNQTITLPTNSVTLSGSGVDPDGSITGYLWRKVSGPAAGTITNPTSAVTTVTGMAQGVYQFELTVTDNNNATGKDTMQVTVNAAPNIPPTANAGPDQTITLPPTNSVTLTGSGTDPDGFITAYTWTKISGPANGTITNPNSNITTAIDLVQGAYEFELRVTDNNGATGRDTVQINVNPPPNILPTANAGPDQTVNFPANSSALTGSGFDPDGLIVRYDWRQLSGPSNNVLFSLVNAATFINNLIEGEYEFELMVTDNNGATANDTIKVTVTGPPSFVPEKNEFKIYPNPVAEIATLDIKSTKLNSVLSIVVTDLNGKMMYKKEMISGQLNFSEKIDLRNLAKGLYIVSVYFDGVERQAIKVVKM